ncbi:histidine phosphatase family protein [Rhodoferax sp.]|uniref:histidine phosphatase family protein n=1 Tax=Rhodoferax sp. TaxID=50421 RepID=UPI00274CE874|nr:histidine phosphatase family protein [Rhodoferax sp.]
MNLWLVRHAQPLVEPGVCYGATDLAADAAGTLRAATAAAAVLPMGACLLTSPLRRCEQLAQSLCGLRPDLTCRPDARLVEMNFGCWEGQRWDAIPRAAFDPWMADFGGHAFGGVETVDALMQRVASVWDESLQSPNEQVWITHAGVIRAATLIAQGVRQVTCGKQWPRDVLAFGECRALALGASAGP